MRSCPSSEGKVSLAYLDPPFFTGRVHDKVTRGRDASGKVLRALSPAFDDRWGNLPSYLGEPSRTPVGDRRLLAPHGCVIVHVDPRTSHYIKVLCDEIFGDDAFASEIVWRYRRWPAKTPNFQRVHDVCCATCATPRFARASSSSSNRSRRRPSRRGATRKQRAVVGDDGRRTRSSTTAQLSPGAPLGDVWEIGIIAPVAKERTGYPTQKPEALLDRLISSCTHPGDLVLDPYAG